MGDERVLSWLRALDASSTWTTSVCSGSLILGAAGLLQGKRATTHWMMLEQLKSFGATPVAERVVFDGKMVAAAGVSAGIDMALALVGKQFGDLVAQSIQLAIEYDPTPPYATGSPRSASPEVIAATKALFEQSVRS
jgi:transcriptional regulator GlxA family with amidase domain